MICNPHRLSLSEFLAAVANAELAQGLTINADEYNRRAAEARELEHALACASAAPAASWLPIEAAPKDGTTVVTFTPDAGPDYPKRTLNMFTAGRWLRSDPRHPPTLFVPLPPPVQSAPAPQEIAA